jgi:4-amino-4-deoxy-L-arabinose transferase-like glycosyltransferase
MKINRNIIILGFIVVIAFLLRFIQVSNNPPSLSWDEVSIGYNAYSILKTGMDEHGRFMPLDTFIGYGDYKPPLSIYITIPFFALFGLNELSVRLPSVLFGTGIVALMYFVIQELLIADR